MIWRWGALLLCFWVPAQLYKQNPTLLHDNDPSSLTREICNWLRFWSQQSQHLQSRHSSRDLRNLSCGGVCKQAGRTSRAQPKKAPAVKPEDMVHASTFRIAEPRGGKPKWWMIRNQLLYVGMYIIRKTQSHVLCKICSMHGVLIIHGYMIYVCVNHLKPSNSGLGKRQLPGLPAMTSTVPSQICSEQRPVFVVQTYQIQCMEPWKTLFISWNYVRKSQSLIQLLYLKSNTSLEVSYQKSTGEFNPKRLIATKWLSNFQIAIQAIQVLWLCPGRHHPNQGHCESTASLPLEPQEKQFDGFPYEQDGTFDLLLQKVDASHMMTATQSLVGNTVETANSQQYLKARTQHYQSKIDNLADSKSLPTEKSIPCPQVLWQCNVLQQLLHRCYQFRDQSGRRCRT